MPYPPRDHDRSTPRWGPLCWDTVWVRLEQIVLGILLLACSLCPASDNHARAPTKPPTTRWTRGRWAKQQYALHVKAEGWLAVEARIVGHRRRPWRRRVAGRVNVLMRREAEAQALGRSRRRPSVETAQTYLRLRPFEVQTLEDVATPRSTTPRRPEFADDGFGGAPWTGAPLRGQDLRHPEAQLAEILEGLERGRTLRRRSPRPAAPHFPPRPPVLAKRPAVEAPCVAARLGRGHRAWGGPPRVWATAVGIVHAYCGGQAPLLFTIAAHGHLIHGRTAAQACLEEFGTLAIGQAANPGPPSWAARVLRPMANIAATAAGGLLDAQLLWTSSDVTSPLRYPTPGKQGFHGVHTAGFDVQGPPLEPFALEVMTANTTGWRQLRKLLEKTSAHVVFAQEHRLTADEVPGASAWARRHGWKSVWTPAVPGPAGGPSAGTVVLAQDFCGLRHPDSGPSEVVPGRVVSAVVEAPSMRPFVGYAAYFHDGQELGRDNLGLIASIAAHFQSQGDDRLQFIVAADFNMQPTTIARSGLASQMRGAVVAPSNARGTCRTRTSARTIDFFYMSASMAEVVRHVDTIEGTGVLTHTPVSAIFHDRPTALKVLSLRRPPKLAKERVYGPLPPPPRQWSQIRVDADSLCAYARRGGCAKVAADKLDVLYKQWADTAEDELADVTASSPSKRGRRGVHPRLMWRSLLPERTGRFGHTKASPSAAWAWLADVLRDASRLRQKTCELDAEEAAERYSQPVQRPRRNRRHRVQPRWPNRDAPRRDDDGGPEADRDEREDVYEALLKALDSELRPFDEVDGIAKAAEKAKGQRLAQRLGPSPSP